ncbi:aminodeoxychorismate synthase component I [Ostreiculturibacter nitratireducens]|uniref:aminodeoxychorismate synthase component I n=1 Tax=Ostreiculturibacter nitratireducens TaxID=3075226 RepID=UPI0031B60361
MILVEHGPGGRPALFNDPVEVIRADDPEEVGAALSALEAALGRGAFVAGFGSYELGYVFEPRLLPLLPASRRLPLLHFGVYDAPEAADPTLDRAETEAGAAGLSTPEPIWDAAAHATAMARLLAYVRAGDLYQANLTMPMRARWWGTPIGLYGALRRRQAVGHGACLVLPGLPAIVSRSPELFYSTDALGRIETRPMKGTAPRGRDGSEDEALRAGLSASEKNRAENLMIVDLLRNDISRISRVGSVRVPGLFEVETYATVHQMTSRVTGHLLPGTGPAELIPALFPCGSVTGAPKIRAMQIIQELEAGPRDIYCGAIGWIGPDRSSSFNVAIRTLTLWPDGKADLGVGGGVVADSTAEGEYEEALWKSRFAQTA